MTAHISGYVLILPEGYHTSLVLAFTSAFVSTMMHWIALGLPLRAAVCKAVIPCICTSLYGKSTHVDCELRTMDLHPGSSIVLAKPALV